MNIAVFIWNISSVILQFKLLFLFPFGLVLEKIRFWFKHETITWTVIWELIQRHGEDVPSKRHWVFQFGFAWDFMVSYLWDVVTTFLCDMCRRTLRRLGDVPSRGRWVFHLRLVWDVVETYQWRVIVTYS